VSDTSSEAHRHACEVRHIARLMWRGNEKSQLEYVAKFMGKNVADDLMIEAMDLVQKARNKNG